VFKPISRQSLSQSVYERLRDGIVSGELGSGTKLPSERDLSQALGVNRGAVREALKRLEQARLVSIRQGGAAKVLDYRDNAGLDLLSELLFAGGNLDVAAAKGVIEMRGVLGPEIARRCAERRSEEIARRLEEVVEALVAEPELEGRQGQSLEFWSALVEGSQNVAYRLAYNSLHASYDTFRGALVEVMGEELRDEEGFRAIARAVRARDGEAAAEAANRLLQQGAQALESMLDLLSNLSDEPHESSASPQEAP
jgi:GntR family transcriptional regulator, transcriptional repressor for pyruvate dehydrogenase complex